MLGGIYRLYYYLFPQSSSELSFSNEISWEITATDSPDKFPSEAIICFLKYCINENISTIKVLSSSEPVLIIKKKYNDTSSTILRFVTNSHCDISQGNYNIKFDFKGNGIEWWPNPSVCPEDSISASVISS